MTGENKIVAGMSQEPRMAGRPMVRVKPRSYQPTRGELEEPIKTDATPEELALAVLRPVRAIEDRDA